MTSRPPLWKQPIPIIGLTGEFASGKTLFGLTIAPKETLYYDLEQSAASYGSLGFQRIDVAAEMLKQKPSGYKSADVYQWWVNHVRSIEPGKYRVIMLDPASEIESGLTSWVEDHPEHFGRTKAQYAKMDGLKWGDMKEAWKAILTDLSARCETFVFVTHMGAQFKGNAPTGKRKPRGKETLFELASLYLQMERKADEKGRVPDKPSAIVLKSRLVSMTLDVSGDFKLTPTLPPRVPVATPVAIRAYIEAPPNYEKLRKDELAPEEKLSEDEKLQLQAQRAADEKESELLKLERINKQQVADAAAAERAASRQAAAASQPPAAAPPAVGGITEKQLEQLANYRGELLKLGATGDQWRAIVAKRGVQKATELTEVQANELISSLAHKLDCIRMQQESAALANGKS